MCFNVVFVSFWFDLYSMLIFLLFKNSLNRLTKPCNLFNKILFDGYVMVMTWVYGT